MYKPRVYRESGIARQYLDWHKTLGAGIYCCDIDSLEARWINKSLELKAVVETYNLHSPVNATTWLQSKVYPLLIDKLNIPLYRVGTTPLLDVFIINKYPGGEAIQMTPEEYKTWLQDL